MRRERLTFQERLRDKSRSQALADSRLSMEASINEGQQELNKKDHSK